MICDSPLGSYVYAYMYTIDYTNTLTQVMYDTCDVCVEDKATHTKHTHTH